ncbi:dexA exonuclease A [Erwinia phage phiEa2809]|uniref:DexA exonuclease A n=1 Tax=Erwinia phage phiEa2809 TaxID=1564096 RepID=A0A0A0YVB2_9CAUD|nr:exonuclease [Erwinia phage phiEa2809]AIX13021.1 dexA exonuclease A [Erwinia phage phiEa2809]
MYKSNYLAVADSETLGRWDTAIMLSWATTLADLTKKYEFLELVEDHTFFIKLDASEQMKLGRETDKPTMDWWQSGGKRGPSEEAKAVSLRPSANDRSIFTLADDIRVGCHRLGIDPRSVDWCDRNMFDLRKAQHIIEVTCGQDSNEPWHYHDTFDIVSWLKGVGQTDRYAGVKAWEIEGMVYHDPRHDAALDWLRVQKTMVQFMGLEVK